MPRPFGWNAFGFGFGPRGFFWEGPRRRRRQWFESGDMKYVILRLLRDKPRHGYEVMKELEEQLHGCYSPSPGTVYPTLQWLEDEGLVVAMNRSLGRLVRAVYRAGWKARDEATRARLAAILDKVLSEVEAAAGAPDAR